MDELGLIDYIVGESVASRGVRVGPGDDCAVLLPITDSELVVTTDEIVEGTHFRLSGEGVGPEARGVDIGYKAACISFSDIAAMGAVPVAFVATAALRKGMAEGLGKTIHAGLIKAAEEFNCPLVGGNLSTTSGPISVTSTVIGKCAPGSAYLRSGAQKGDAIFVTGELGGSILGRHFSFTPRLAEVECLRKIGGINACMDISDGLSLDLHRLCKASNLGAEIEALDIPMSEDAHRMAKMDGELALKHALTDGEDFELLFTVDEQLAETFEQRYKHATPITRIGRMLGTGDGLWLRDNDSRVELSSGGFTHL